VTAQSVEGLAAGWMARVRSSSPGRSETFIFVTAPRPVPIGLTQLLNQCVRGALSPGIKQLGHEADHSAASSAEVKNGGSLHPLPHMSSWSSD
jgi:hypothetical protein